MALKATVSYNGTGAQTDFVIPFPYVREGFIHVFLSSVEQTRPAQWDFLNPTTVRFVTPPPSGTGNVTIQRITDTDAIVTDFTQGSGVTEMDLEDALNQLLHVTEEATDVVENNFTLDGGEWDAQGLRIKNLGAADSGDDAVRNDTIQPFVAAAAASAAAAATSETNADTSETNAAASASAAAASAAASAASAATIDDVLPLADELNDPGDNGKTLIVRSDTYEVEDWRPVSYESNGTDHTTLSITVPIPATGTYDIEVFGVVHYRTTGANANAVVAINEDTDAGSPTDVAWGSGGPASGGVGFPFSVSIFHPRRNATNGENYVFTLNEAGAPDTQNVDNTPSPSVPNVHTLYAKRIRTG